MVTPADTAASSKGLLTGRVTKTYYSASYVATNTKTEAYYYDKYGRLLQTVAKNFAGGSERITNKYNFANQVVQTRYNHYVFSITDILDVFCTYDHRGRLLTTEYAVDTYANDLPRTIVSANVYNEAGLLKTKYLHSQSGQAFMQKVDYRFNIRGWLTAINDTCTEFSEGDRFGMRLWYNRKPDGTAGLYNGNISNMGWSAPNYQNLQYAFTYDGANRLTQAEFTGAGFSANSFKENYNYDKNGNIEILQRFGMANSPAIDHITYGYEGASSNRLMYSYDSQGDVPGVEDFSGTLTGTTAHYGYDPNGNLIRDDYKDLDITYNNFNLPDQLDLANNNRINYFYNSTGEKMLRAVSENGGTPEMTYYFGSFVHEGTQGGTSSLKYIITSEGRILNTGTDGNPVWEWEYYLKDHLGNVRVVIEPTNTPGYSAVLQETHYYPFGMRISQLSSSANSTNDYLFSGKQLESNFDLGWYDFGGRGNYDAPLNIWRSPDPMAELNYQVSPYAYAANNPIRFIDPDGMLESNFEDEEGNLIKHIDDGSNAVFKLTGDSRSEEYFKFNGYDEKQGGSNEVNVQSVIDYTQDYTRKNYTSDFLGYKKDEKGNVIIKDGKQVEDWKTYCNQGTFCIAKSVNSALEQIGGGFEMSTFEGKWGALFAGDIYKNLTKNNSAVNLSEAQEAAKQGGFVVGGWSSHAFTLNKSGLINNIGAKRLTNNLWDPKVGGYPEKSTKFYILYKH
jgi:RHS repeat-associated protein